MGALITPAINRRAEQRATHKRTLGRVLADLLEVHYLLRVLQVLRNTLEAAAPGVGAQVTLVVPQVVGLLIPDVARLPQRFDTAVTELAGLDPLLAFEVRSKDVAVPVLAQLSRIAAATPGGASTFPPLLTMITDHAVESLATACRTVARAFGASVVGQVESRLMKSMDDLPVELREWINKAAATSATAAAQG